MTVRTGTIVAIVWMLSLVAVGTVVAGQAKTYRQLPEPKLITGDDVGFRVDGMVGEVPSGRLVVRVNGQWVEVTIDALSGSPRGLVR